MASRTCKIIIQTAKLSWRILVIIHRVPFHKQPHHGRNKLASDTLQTCTVYYASQLILMQLPLKLLLLPLLWLFSHQNHQQLTHPLLGSSECLKHHKNLLHLTVTWFPPMQLYLWLSLLLLSSHSKPTNKGVSSPSRPVQAVHSYQLAREHDQLWLKPSSQPSAFTLNTSILESAQQTVASPPSSPCMWWLL